MMKPDCESASGHDWKYQDTYFLGDDDGIDYVFMDCKYCMWKCIRVWYPDFSTTSFYLKTKNDPRLDQALLALAKRERIIIDALAGIGIPKCR